MTEAKLIRMSQKNPLWWMNQCGWRLWKKQKEIVRSLMKYDRVAVPAAFGVGKTWIAAHIAMWWLCTHVNSIVVTTAATRRQVRDLLWGELREAHASSRLPLGGEMMTMDYRPDAKNFPRWFATGFATNEENIDKFTGYHAPNMLLIFDQAAGIARNVWTGGEGLMTSEGAKWLAISNTTDEASVMADICLPDRRSEYGKWEVIKITAHDSPNVRLGYNAFPGIIAHDWVEKKRGVWRPTDPFWQMFVEANFVESGAMVVLTQSLIKSLLSNIIEPDFNQITMGVDVGDEGTDATVITVALGERLGFIEEFHGNDTMMVVDRVRDAWKKVIRLTENKPKVINVDKIGIGAGVVSRLNQLGYPAIGVNTSEGAYDDEQYLNRRIEMAWAIREKGEARSMSLSPLYHTEESIMDCLREDMSIRYQMLPSGSRIQLEPKKNFRKRMKRSCDYWDSMVLAFGDDSSVPRVTAVEIPELMRGHGNKPMSHADEETKAFLRKLFSTQPTDDDFGEETLL